MVDMEPETVQVGTTRSAILSMMTETATRRYGEQLVWVINAVDQFKDHSKPHIEQHLAHLHQNTDIQFMPLIEGFISGITMAIEAAAPEAAAAKWLWETSAHFLVENLDAQLEHETSPLASAREKLENGVIAMAAKIREREAHTISNGKSHIAKIVEDGVAHFESLSDDHDWIDQTLAYLGFPEPDEATISYPIRQQLEYEFVGLLYRVATELEKDEHPDWDFLNPDEAEKAGQDHERKLYHDEGTRAWDDAYRLDR